MMHELSAFVEKLTTLTQQAPTLKGLDTQALFAALLKNGLLAQLSPESYAHTIELTESYTEAVNLARKGALDSAVAQLHRADATLAAMPSGAGEFAELFRLSAWAYYHYKTKNGALGAELLYQGLALSASLERRGFPTLVYRRIEQLQNIALVYSKSGQPMLALQLLKNTFTYIHSGQANGLFIDDWGAAIIGQVPMLQEATLRGVSRQLAECNTSTMRHPDYGDAYFYRTVVREVLAQFETTTYNRVVLYNWLYVKASYYEQGPVAFLANVLEFVCDPEVARDYDHLKANLLAQAIWHIEQQPEPASTPLLETIRTFAENHLLDSQGKGIRIAA